MSKKILQFGALVVVVLAFSMLHAAIPKLIHFQGLLMDSTRNPLTGNYSMTFRIYDASSGGSLLWNETQTVSVNADGTYNAMLGSVTTIDLAFDNAYWISLEIESDGEMTPRYALATSRANARCEPVASYSLISS